VPSEGTVMISTTNHTGSPGEIALEAGIAHILAEISNGDHNGEHLKNTPQRYVRGFLELVSGLKQDPASVLKTAFTENHYNQMIAVEQIDFVSICAHHLLPFYGIVNFAYLPNKKVVGLSKIPRMIEILSRRPQIQEQLTQQIVDTFQKVVQPLGCGCMIEAWHACVGIRGVRKPNTRMRTTALAGFFLTKPSVKEEFLMGVLAKR
jgi:GTP cyclohydrolase I